MRACYRKVFMLITEILQIKTYKKKLKKYIYIVELYDYSNSVFQFIE